MKKLNKFFSFVLVFVLLFSTILFTKDTGTAQAASIRLSSSSMALELGHYSTLKVYGTTRRATWRTSNSWIATVSSTGKVTARAAGTATITATVAGKRLTCKLTVLRIVKKSFSMIPGQTSTITISGTKSPVTWSTSDSSIATVTTTGNVTAKKSGVVSITASVLGKKLTSTITVIDISDKSTVLELGGSYGYVRYLEIIGTTKPVTWSTSNKSVATVSSNGTVLAKGAGNATITATVDGHKLICTVEVLKMSTKAFTLNVGETKTLKIYGTTNQVVWTSNKKSVAIVSNDGTITAIAPGAATITGYVDGKNVTSKVTVVSDSIQ